MKKVKPEIPKEVDQILKDIGLKIRTRRKAIANNYEDFAHDYNFNKVTIHRIENGDNYTIRTLILVAKAMGLSLEEIFKGVE